MDPSTAGKYFSIFLMIVFVKFSLVPFIVRIQYILHKTYKICVHFLLPVRPLVNSRLLVVLGESEVICGYLTGWEC